MTHKEVVKKLNWENEAISNENLQKKRSEPKKSIFTRGTKICNY